MGLLSLRGGIRTFVGIVAGVMVTGPAHHVARATVVKDLWILRHGQAMHNPRAEAKKAAGCTHDEFLQQMKEDDVLDAPLTELGIQQGRAVYERYHHLYQHRVELVASSPLSRALATADLAAPHHPRRVCCEPAREINGWLLNARRRPRAELRRDFPHWCFDGLAHEDDRDWTPALEAEAACAARGYATLEWILARPEQGVLLVAHGGILRFLMTLHPRVAVRDGRRRPAGETAREPHARFDNCELRRYRLEREGGGASSDSPRLVLTELDMDHDIQ